MNRLVFGTWLGLVQMDISLIVHLSEFSVVGILQIQKRRVTTDYTLTLYPISVTNRDEENLKLRVYKKTETYKLREYNLLYIPN